MFEYIRFVFRNPSYVTESARAQSFVRKAMEEFREQPENKTCAWCGRDKKLEVHHIIPVSLEPAIAASKQNMIMLCRKPACHQIIGHDGDFGRRYVSNVKELCENNKTVSIGNLERRFDDTGIL